MSTALCRTYTLFSITLLACGIWAAEMWLDPYSIRILNLLAINAILALSLNLIYGFTGMFSLGHAGFIAIGAYVCSLLILSPEKKEEMWILEPISGWLLNLSLPFPAAVVVSGFVAAIVGIIIALPVLRLGGDYLGIATLGFAEIIRVVITNATGMTNGPLGIKGIPEYTNLWNSFGWLLITLYAIYVLLKSNVGNVFKAIRDDEIAAKTMGINTFFYRVLSFAIGSFFAGVGGALMAALISTIDPKMFNFLLTFNILMIVVAGGLGSLTGSILGSIIITILLEWLRFVEAPLHLGTFGFAGFTMQLDIPGIPGMRMVIFSILLMCIILFRREGIMGMREFSWAGCANIMAKLKGKATSLASRGSHE